MKLRKRLLIYGIIASLLIVASAGIILPRTEYDIYRAPSGEYKAIFTYRSYLAFIPMMPGSSGDKSGFVKIIDNSGNDYGELPLEMLNAAEFRWTEYGAEIYNGKWNFKKGTCYHWDSSGEHKVFIKDRKPSHPVRPTSVLSVVDQ